MMYMFSWFIKTSLTIQLTDPQFEVLKSISELSGDTIDEYLLAVVIQGLQSDIELYLGRSKTSRK
jgi:hypothetical protein